MVEAESAGPRIELRGVGRDFGPLVAVRELDLRLEPGRLHAIIGENGAGKSTVLKMMAGHLPVTGGSITIDSTPLLPPSPQLAIAQGVGMVHQHFMLVEPFTALENLVLGCEPTTRGGILDLETAREKAESLGKRVGLQVPLDRKVSELSVGERQRLEILRVLYRGARALLLDEPTAVLAPLEVDELYTTLRKLAAGGATIAVVTHRLDEVIRFCDCVTVMRRGEGVFEERLQPERQRSSAAKLALSQQLTAAIMGGELPAPAEPAPCEPEAEPVLVLENLVVARPDSAPALSGLSLRLSASEIVGVAGVEGNGQRELVRAIAGLTPLAAGRIIVNDLPVFRATPHTTKRPAELTRAPFVQRARDVGLVVVHEDRHRDELVLEATVSDNLVLGDLAALASEPAAQEARFGRFNIQPSNPQHLASALSGGNQQKLVMARALDRDIVALVLAQPTRGVDVAAARTIQSAIADAARDGAAVLLISADLNELRALSHRIVVLRRGRIVAELEPSASDEAIGRAMLGGDEEAA